MHVFVYQALAGYAVEDNADTGKFGSRGLSRSDPSPQRPCSLRSTQSLELSFH